MKPSFDIGSYFKRIQFDLCAKTDLATLRELHKQHVFSIPFENLDIHYGNPISLEPEKLFQKIIINKRGGYCFELNGLFQLLLEHLGFQVYSASARVLFDSEGVPPRSHRLLIVDLEKDQWLVDVGFGANGLVEPIPLKVGVEHHQFKATYKLEPDQELGFIFKAKESQGWVSQYAFSLERHLPIDFVFPNYYHSHCADSMFTKKKICQLRTRQGKKRLIDRKLSISSNGQVHDTIAKDEDEYLKMLEKHFNIEIA